MTRVIQNRYFRVTLPAKSAAIPSERIEDVVVSALESFIQTTGLEDGTRSAQIVAWRGVFERTVMSACLGDEEAA